MCEDISTPELAATFPVSVKRRAPRIMGKNP
jgi:hypothetical protein